MVRLAGYQESGVRRQTTNTYMSHVCVNLSNTPTAWVLNFHSKKNLKFGAIDWLLLRQTAKSKQKPRPSDFYFGLFPSKPQQYFGYSVTHDSENMGEDLQRSHFRFCLASFSRTFLCLTMHSQWGLPCSWLIRLNWDWVWGRYLIWRGPPTPSLGPQLVGPFQ